ncbi:hypothetical protein SAMN04487895_102259 [Paenibacillus sophorae]|uniref:Uncharacterized protein n=1 Tax=Paenibacillus sophorae TaxID=1333845 RepID=A0A1H8IMV5_9BACL|nr:hypothetical protein SAMN04487895_102259 [Paenibacillus sophorae]
MLGTERAWSASIKPIRVIQTDVLDKMTEIPQSYFTFCLV